MTHTRRNVLRKASALSALAVGAAGISTTTAAQDTIETTDGIPSNAFAPFHHMTTAPDDGPSKWSDLAETPYLHLAFVLGTGDGTPAWDGDPDYVVGESKLDDQIENFRDDGGEVVISYGGAIGNYLVSDYDDPDELADAFEFVVDEYGSPYIDIDDEGGSQAEIDLRNEALSILQDRRSEVKVSYTVRASTQGVMDEHIIDSAIDHGVDIHWVNPMTMNYGWIPPDADAVISTAESTHDQLTEWFPDRDDDELYNMIGITPMIGENDVGGAFYPEDAVEVLSYAQDNDIGLLSFWSVERDNGDCPDGSVDAECSGIEQDDFEFSHTFNEFNS
ncbi:hypothetical protein [Natrarchaeobius oligotrophus]|uniref:GH18 domain-containing protein n=1 Tax=Natrarchaeobius chitinivorans TaxID=1679083 RepID=A0A3N6M6J6_NATCH|nr:hypothetical protein [Natrarchaeobius chitinivorans]RQG99208.1 hypothetical protein EA472_15185 [Natrarchaeobius chitinivorans]